MGSKLSAHHFNSDVTARRARGVWESEITTSPLATSEEFAAERPPSATPRSQPSPGGKSLAWARVKRGAKRQALPLLIATFVIAALGCAFEMASGAPLNAVAAYWIAIGFGASCAVVLARELGRNTITSLAKLGRHRGYAVLGAAPELSPAALRQLPPDARTPLGVMTQQPASAFAAAFRDLQGAVSSDGVVAIIAPSIDEGASTVAMCAAVSARQQGRRVIVLDCDLRRRSLTRAMGRDPAVGVLEAARAPESWRDFVEEEEESGLAFIPAAPLATPWGSLVGAPGFDALIQRLRSDYDLILLDCPPALGNAEGGLLARLAHRCVIVATWDGTPFSALRATMRVLRRRSRATTALFINRVPPGYRFGRLQSD